MAERGLLSISEVAEATGLQSSALRYYEKVGLLVPAARAGGRRHYHPSVLQRLAAIALFQEVGFTIAEVRQLLGGRPSQKKWRSMAKKKLDEIDAHSARVGVARALLVSALDCDCRGLETCGLVSERRGRHRQVVQRISPRIDHGRLPTTSHAAPLR
jgi:DNA-binding transcriptional MerR regulator